MTLRHRRKFDTRQVHINEIEGIKYVCKGVLEFGTFYLLGILK